MSSVLIPGLIILIAGVCWFGYTLVAALLRTVERVTETNKQLLILVAGQGGKSELAGPTMRALVASEKPPQGKLKGIAGLKKEKKTGSTNTNYEMTIGAN